MVWSTVNKAPELSSELSIVILAGGQASRMNGNDKGLVLWKGAPLIQTLLDAFQAYKSDLWINANRNIAAYQQLHPKVLTDRHIGFLGPLAGIETALFHLESPWIFFVACDMPFLTPSVLHALCSAAKQTTERSIHAWIPNTSSGLQPTCLLLKCDPIVKKSLDSYLHSGNRKVLHWLEEIGYQALSFSEETFFINTNSYEDIHTYSTIFS